MKKILGIADKMKSVRLVQIFCPVKETNRTHSKGYVEDLSTQAGRKRCAKMAVLNLSVLPIYALLLCVLLVPAQLCAAANLPEEDFALGGICIGDTRADVEALYGKGNHVADGVDVWNGEDVGMHVIDYGASLSVTYRSSDRGWYVISVHLGVNDVNEYNVKPSEESRSFETPRGIHLDSTREDLEEAYGYLPKPKCSNNAPPVCGYFYDGETAQLAFYICAEHSPGIRSIWLHEK